MYDSLPLYCPSLMRIVGSMYTSPSCAACGVVTLKLRGCDVRLRQGAGMRCRGSKAGRLGACLTIAMHRCSVQHNGDDGDSLVIAAAWMPRQAGSPVRTQFRDIRKVSRICIHLGVAALAGHLGVQDVRRLVLVDVAHAAPHRAHVAPFLAADLLEDLPATAGTHQLCVSTAPRTAAGRLPKSAVLVLTGKTMQAQ